MTESHPPEGARTNGLASSDWIVVAATTPPIADNLLVALREAGIAAFTLPQVDDSVYRGLSLNSPLSHSVFVDRSKRKMAMEVVAKERAELERGMGTTEFDEIVSQLSMASGSSYLDELDRLDHFEPPVPGSLPNLSKGTKIALLGVFGGPALLILNALTQFDPTGFVTWFGLSGFIAGLVALLLRTKDPDEELPPDGGAIV
jgi:hypothetical protein